MASFNTDFLYLCNLMTNAKRDGNYVPTLTALLDSDGATIVNVYGNASNHGVKADDNTTGTGTLPTNDPRDENRVPVAYALSATDGTTLVPLYADSSGNLLITSV